MSYIDTKHLFKCETCLNYRGSTCGGNKCYTYCDHGESYYPNMREIPPADVVEVRHGFWDRRYSKHIDHLGEFLKYEGDFCSICGAMGSGKYCSECGAKMDGERSENGT